MSKEIEIADLIEKFIREGTWKAGEKIPSEHELSELYQVNHKTANKAVAKLVERGLIVRTVGRGGSKVATTLPAKGVIAYRLPLLSAGVFCAQMLKGAESAARAATYDIKYFELTYPEDTQWQKIANASICGAIFTACAPPPETFPFPAINALHPFGTNFIASDDFDGGRQAAELFLANGHRNIAVITDNPNESTDGRCGGFIRTLKNNGIPCPEKLFFSIPLDNEINIKALWDSISSLPQKVTGAFCYSDTIAMHLLLHLNSLGIKVPQDFSICGFGNMQTVNIIMPLTTVRQFPETLGYNACTKLIELIEKTATAPIEIHSPVELINPRNTVAAAPEN